MASTEDLQNEILEGMYDGSDSIITAFFNRQGIIGSTVDQGTNIDESDVKFALKDLEERHFVERDGTVISLTGRGLARLSEQGFETGVDPDLQESLLEQLLQHMKDDPDHPEVSLEDLSSALGVDRELIDENIIILDWEGYVDIEHINQTVFATITQRGRQRIK